MPRHGAAPQFEPKESKVIDLVVGLLRRVVDRSRGQAAAEAKLRELTTEVGRRCVEQDLDELDEDGPFEEDGVIWRVALRSTKKVMTTFGWAKVRMTRFRAKRGGPTRCLVVERAELVQGKWTPLAAQAATLATSELPYRAAANMLGRVGTMRPSPTLLQRLDRHVNGVWEEDRAKHERWLRDTAPIPTKAVVAVASLDGVMVNVVGSTRAAKVARAQAAGRSPKGPSGYKEAAVGVVSFYDAKGNRLATRRMGRMPEKNKEAVRAWLRDEVAWIRQKRPSIKVVAAADGANHNWTFLETLVPDLQVVDYYHVAEYLTRWISQANGPSTLDTQEKLKEARRLLLEEPDGAARAFAMLAAARRAAGSSVESGYLTLHRDRMNYAALREANIPIGTGVTEGTCRTLLVDRMRRSGMAWSQVGGQAVLTIRGFLVSDLFDEGWTCVMRSEADRRRRKLSA